MNIHGGFLLVNARQNASGKQPNSLLLQQLSGVSHDGSEYVSASDSDGASVGAPTRARHVNDRSAPAFDMNGVRTSVIPVHFTTCACCERLWWEICGDCEV